MRTLPLPDFFDPAAAGRDDHSPDAQALLGQAARWRQQHKIRPAGEDRRRRRLLLIDPQKDFCLPSGTLYVGGRSGRGAVEDTARLAAFIYQNLDQLSEITTTMDTHLPFQIFFSAFWLGEDGQPLAPFQELRVADIDAGRARPNPALAAWLCDGDEAWLARQARDYCAQLEAAGKYTLYLWPPHTILGSPGHALVGLLQEARLFHAYARGVQPQVEIKGLEPLSERYSVLSPEVLWTHDDRPLGAKNTALLDRLLAADTLIVAGQAASHCVKSSIDDLLEGILARDPARAGRVYILSDCMSAVAVPDGEGGFVADFTPQVEAAFARYAEAGMHIVRSTQPMSEWPALR